MKPPSPKADALRQMRERQHVEMERKSRATGFYGPGDVIRRPASRADLDKAVRAVKTKPKKHK